MHLGRGVSPSMVVSPGGVLTPNDVEGKFEVLLNAKSSSVGGSDADATLERDSKAVRCLPARGK